MLQHKRREYVTFRGSPWWTALLIAGYGDALIQVD
jgi:hypothetical protein